MEIPGISPSRRVEKSVDGYIVYVKPPAFFTQAEVAVHLTPDQYQRYVLWREGAGLIQDVLDDLSEDDRERLMTGLTDENWPDE